VNPTRRGPEVSWQAFFMPLNRTDVARTVAQGANPPIHGSRHTRILSMAAEALLW